MHSVPGPSAPSLSVCRTPVLSVSAPGALCFGPRTLCRAPALSVSAPPISRRLCSLSLVSEPGAFCVGARLSVGPALSVSGPGSLCVGAGVSVSGPGALSVGPQRSVCQARHPLALCVRIGVGLALCVGAGALPALSAVSGPSALCVGARRSQRAPGQTGRRGRGQLRSACLCGSSPRLRSACHPSSGGLALTFAGPQLRSACHPSSPFHFSRREPQTLLFGGKRQDMPTPTLSTNRKALACFRADAPALRAAGIYQHKKLSKKTCA